ncbi:hypothetical protein BDV29DRAFT_15332 [Aspergillus leporis]|jgi:hypothetical protein|uniref:Uncharacterized protein n=1 Tax=Aspergillus leporis TaxID=41062 RepID=A0A5N5XC40_9EURO|nr:hypothetical protein BDV29DRAFT_15332 [Aspergillus leporis]
MPDPPKRVLEKSRTVRRRYQRSDKRLTFSASQIARIEREEERERRAQKLQDKEKRRIANKKKKAEKEAKAREERRRLGLPDLNAPTVPSSQPSLFNFLKNKTGPQAPADSETTCEDTEPDTPGSISTEADSCQESCSENDETGDADAVGPELFVNNLDGTTEPNDINHGAKDDDEFSDCSIFYNEDIIKEAGIVATVHGALQALPEIVKPEDQPAPIALAAGESFRDDTAILLEEFACEFDTDEELLRLDAG